MKMKVNERYQSAVQCKRGHKGTAADWGMDCRSCLRSRIAELEQALEKIANYKEVHSDIQGSQGLVAIAEQALKGEGK